MGKVELSRNLTNAQLAGISECSPLRLGSGRSRGCGLSAVDCLTRRRDLNLPGKCSVSAAHKRSASPPELHHSMRVESLLSLWDAAAREQIGRASCRERV